MTMNTMTLLDDYVDALLDGGALDVAIGHDRITHDCVDQHLTGHGGAHFDAIADARMPDEALTAGEPAGTFDAATPPAPATPFVPAFVPAVAPAPVAAPTHASPVATPIDPATGPAGSARETPLAAMAASHRWLRVTVGDDSYALELLRVQEVVRLAPIVALRGAARAVLGVMNLRGRIVPVLDLGLWLQAGCVHGDERSRIVVVERDDEMIGMLVSAVEDVVTLGRERIEPPLASSDPGAIVGIARVGAAPTVLLDANALFG